MFLAFVSGRLAFEAKDGGLNWNLRQTQLLRTLSSHDIGLRARVQMCTAVCQLARGVTNQHNSNSKQNSFLEPKVVVNVFLALFSLFPPPLDDLLGVDSGKCKILNFRLMIF
jgi:hypothetical protein